MSLIQCKECSNDISSMAESCPKCGCPIKNYNEVEKNGGHVKTIEETSKSLKTYIFLSVSFIMAACPVSPRYGCLVS